MTFEREPFTVNPIRYADESNLDWDCRQFRENAITDSSFRQVDWNSLG